MAKRSATDAERTLWRTAMRDVRRFRTDAAPALAAHAPASRLSETPPESPQPESFQPVAPPARAPGGVDRTTEERIRRGRIAVDGRIDLHGMTQAEAFPALLGFVETSARGGKRALLVITGKGAVSQGGGVLRRSVPGWLAASPLARRILTVAPAHLRHGGDGALYVLLRRDRGRS